jgi:hypothetical protein
MCGALEEGIEVVIQGRASGDERRKFVGRREGLRLDRGAKESPQVERTEGVSAHPREQVRALNVTRGSY